MGELLSIAALTVVEAFNVETTSLSLAVVLSLGVVGVVVVVVRVVVLFFFPQQRSRERHFSIIPE